MVLSVSDTGCGMDEETQAQIFEPFFTTKELGKGTGLGLATVYGIVEATGGDLELESAPGRGTTFRILLPVTAAAPVAREEWRPDPAKPARGSETILLVEDEDTVRDISRESLERHGYTVLTAAHGPEALRICERHPGPIHALVTDIVMPGMSGRQVAERVLRMRPEVQVLYVSGYTEDAVIHHGIRAAEVPFLTKPFSPRVLAAKVQELLERQMTRDPALV
jgi:CheY-like chemotaxis protein